MYWVMSTSFIIENKTQIIANKKQNSIHEKKNCKKFRHIFNYILDSFLHVDEIFYICLNKLITIRRLRSSILGEQRT